MSFYLIFMLLQPFGIRSLVVLTHTAGPVRNSERRQGRRFTSFIATHNRSTAIVSSKTAVSQKRYHRSSLLCEATDEFLGSANSSVGVNVGVGGDPRRGTQLHQQHSHKEQARYRRIKHLLRLQNESNIVDKDDEDNREDSTKNNRNHCDHGTYSAGGLTRNQSKELQGLLSKGDPYDAKRFTEAHIAFKQRHNGIFLHFATFSQFNSDPSTGKIKQRQRQQEEQPLSSFPSQPLPLPVFYLDGPDGLTTETLLASQRYPGDPSLGLYTANEWSDTVDCLRERFQRHHQQQQQQEQEQEKYTSHNPTGRKSKNGICLGTAKIALETTFRDIPFAAAYLDGCGGDPQPIIEMIDALLKVPRDPHSLYIGITLTAAEPFGRSVVDRLQMITRQTIQIMKFYNHYQQLVHVSDEPERFGLYDIVDPTDSKTTTTTTTTTISSNRDRDSIDSNSGIGSRNSIRHSNGSFQDDVTSSSLLSPTVFQCQHEGTATVWLALLADESK